MNTKTTLSIASSILALLVAFPAFAQEKQSDDTENTQAIDELIDGHIDALGGRMSLEVESLIVKAHLAYGEKPPEDVLFSYKGDGVVIFQMKKDEDGEFQTTYGYNNKKQWSSNGNLGSGPFLEAGSFGWIRVMPFLSQQVLHWRDWDAELTRLEDSEIDGQNVHQLNIKMAENCAVTHQFSTESGLMITSKIDLSGTTYFARFDYKEIEGCKCLAAIEITQGDADSAIAYSYRFTDFDFETAIPKQLLKLPDEDGEDGKAGKVDDTKDKETDDFEVVDDGEE